MKRLLLVFVLLVLVLCVAPALARGETFALFVSHDGDDTAAGTREAPLKSLAGARDRVRAMLREGAEGDIRVLFAEGEYFLPETEFGPDDSAPEGHTITYAAAEGAYPMFSGGQRLTGWTRREGQVWEARVFEDLPPDHLIRDLYRNTKRLPRARFPDGQELLTIESVSDDYKTVTFSGKLPAFSPSSDLVVYQNWSISRAPLASSDQHSVTATVPVGWIGHGDATTVSPGKPAYIEHSVHALDLPGEWYHDVANRVVLYYAGENEDPNEHTFIVPRVARMLELHGTAEAPLRSLRFEGLYFRFSQWRMPEFGYMGIQAGHFGTTLGAETYVLPPAVLLLHAEDIGFTDCHFGLMGSTAIALGRGCRDNRFSRCSIDHVGGNGIMIGWRGTGEMSGAVGDASLAADWPDPALAPRNNEIDHCSFVRCGVIHHGCVAIFDAFSKGSHIHHNSICGMPYTGISVGYFWGTKPTSQEGARIEYNSIRDVMYMLADGGGIYTLGYQPGTILRGNRIHSVSRSEFAHGGAPNNGIFFDEGSSGYLVAENYIWDTSGEPIRFNQTDESQFTWQDNHFGEQPEQYKDNDPGPPPYGPKGQRLGVIINEDNSHFFGSRTPEEMTIEGLHAFVDQYAGTKVTHLFLNPSAMRASYDSEVWDAIWELGDQQIPPDCGVCQRWVDNARLLAERGLDPYSVWIARAREKGISPWISMRMNDVHDVSDPANFMHNTFWVDHPEYWRVPGSNGSWVDRAYNYLIPEVRKHHLQLVRELLDRYDMDGLELDWMRFGWHFPPGQEAEGAEVLTEFMREVRDLTQAAAAKRGHHVFLGARVPTDPDAAVGLGMDGVRWAKEGLIDWLVPSPFWATADFDIPIERWRERLGDAQKKLVLAAGMEILLRGYPGGKAIENDLESLRGFSAAALQRGADAIYLFNYMDPGPMLGGVAVYRTLLEEGLRLPAMLQHPRRYVVTYRDTVPPGMASGAVLPTDTSAGLKFMLYTGARPLRSEAVLRIGLAAGEGMEDVVLKATCNGSMCMPIPDETHLAVCPDVARLLQFECSLDDLKEGNNAFELEQTGERSAQIVWAELRVSP